MLKTRHLIVGDKAKGLRMDVGIIKGTESFEYLGIRIASSALSNEEFTSTIGRARSVIKQLNGLLSSKKEQQ